jgi:hypothetical protein
VAGDVKDFKLPETETGTVVYNIDPLIVKYHYEIDYIHSYAQDSPFFVGLMQGKLLGSRCECGYTYATPRAHCMQCGAKTEWVELPKEGRVHTWTTCYFGSEEFLKDTPYHLILVEFDGVDTLFLARLVGAPVGGVSIGMKVKAQFRRLSKISPNDVYFVPA